MSDYTVFVAPPGPNFSFGTVRGLLALVSSKHKVELSASGNGFDDFDILWTQALNASEEGKITHFAMLHLDIVPDSENGEIWLDTLIDEMDRLGLDMCSAISPLKDFRGLTSSGIGDPNDSWSPYRRICVRELDSMPETFNAADLGYPDKPLLHNSGCWACDLRSTVFHQEAEDGTCGAYFAFPERVYRNPATGRWMHARESEDWFFSRCLWRIGAKTAITQKVKLTHMGRAGYKNHGRWGEMEHDDETAYKWATPRGIWDDIPGWFDFSDVYQEQVDRVNGRQAHFVEVGAWLGKSTVFMADAIRKSGKAIRFDCIDNWEGGTEGKANRVTGREIVAKRKTDLHRDFLDNVKRCGVSSFVNPIRGDSTKTAEQYADSSLDFVFIDADHEYESVLRDLRAWYPKVKPGGTLAGHDYHESGPKKAVDEFAALIGKPAQKRCHSFVIQV